MKGLKSLEKRIENLEKARGKILLVAIKKPDGGIGLINSEQSYADSDTMLRTLGYEQDDVMLVTLDRYYYSEKDDDMGKT